MKEYAAGVQSSDLRLVDVPGAARKSAPAESTDSFSGGRRNADGTFTPPSGSDAASSAGDGARADALGSDGARAPQGPGTADKFLTAATKEFEAGIVDQPLWRHAVAQSGDNRTLATQRYLTARATALRVVKRDKREERSARRERAMNELGHPAEADGAAASEAQPKSQPKPASAWRPATQGKRRQVLWIGGALASLFAVALVVAVRSEGGAEPQRTAAKTAAKTTTAAKAASAPAAKSGAIAPDDAANNHWTARIAELKGAGNWNMVVLYAVEWLRKEPENPIAWNELSTGYARLRQYREALDAATRVVQITPEDPEGWRSVGRLNVILQQPVDALAAFEQAIARNDRDASSIVQTGLLNTQLGRFADARLAFARALSLDGQDVDALCGAASLAHKEGRDKDAEAFTRQVSALDGRCRDATAGESVRVAVGAASPPPSRSVR